MTNFDDLYYEYKNLVRAQIQRALNDTSFFYDVEQDVWVKIWRNIHKYNGESFPKWSYSIIRAIVIDKHRRATANKRMQVHIKEEDYDYLYDIKYNLVIDLLPLLPTLQQKVLILKLRGYTFQQISTTINTNINTCIGSYRYGINNIKRHIEKSQDIKKEVIL